MKCLEPHTIEQVKKMSYEELKLLWENICKEKHELEMRHLIVEMLEIIEAKEPRSTLIKN